MKEFVLDGSWRLFCCPPERKALTTPAMVKASGIAPIPAAVPGDIELALGAAGVAPQDPLVGGNAAEFRAFEGYDWFYLRTFELPPDFSGAAELIFDGVDCCASVFLDGELLGECADAFVEHRFPLMLALGSSHELAVRIRSARLEARKYPAEPGEWPQSRGVFNRMTLRKCAHSWGWDIAPRLMLGGIFRSVRIVETPEFRLNPVFVQTNPDSISGDAVIHVFYSFHEPERSFRAAALRLRGSCGDSGFDRVFSLESVSGVLSFSVPGTKRWYPAGYGEPNLYELETELLDADGAVLASRHDRFGVRTLTFDRRTCRFAVNNVPVRIRGVNWSPADALHSREEERFPVLLPLLSELGCNMVRCWGGGLYGSEKFYDYCDEHGILVWQDFAMACALYPQTDHFAALLQHEAELAVVRLRRHPSLAIWCGDNECDQFFIELHRSPDGNRLTREVLPRVLARLDPDRPYVPSSPAVTGADVYAGVPWSDPEEIFRTLPERHLWGARVDFRAPFYDPEAVRFIGETGWHGAPALETIKSMLSPEHCRVDFDDDQWILHGSDAFHYGDCYTRRPHIMRRQLERYFGAVPQELGDFVTASQIFQLEALHHVVQQARLRPEINGFLWWNLTDCWPTFSESLVDYYNRRKPAFFMLRELFRPFAVMLTDDGVRAVNDSGGPVECRICWHTVEDAQLREFSFTAPSGTSRVGVELPESRLVMLSWSSTAGAGVNHKLADLPHAELEFCMRHLAELLHYSGVTER